MNLTRGELLSFQPKKNLVLCESVINPEEVEIGGVKLKIDSSYQPHLWQPVIQKVIATPKQLLYGKRIERVNVGGNQSIQQTDGSWKNMNVEEWLTRQEPIANSMPWKTVMELKANDIIWVGYFSIIKAEAEGRIIICEDKKYYLIPYQDVYLKKQGSSVRMLNGWLLLEPIMAEEQSIVKRLMEAGVIIPHFTKEGDKYAIVRHMGQPVDEYLEPDKEDTHELSVGDTVMLQWSSNRRIKDERSRFFDQTEYIVSRRTNICALIKNQLFD